MSWWKPKTVRGVNPKADWLSDESFNLGHSQFGEEGLIRDTLKRFGVQAEWCFEVGAGDGEKLSNTLWLRRQGWSAVLVERDANQHGRLLRFEAPNIHCVREDVCERGLDAILRERSAPHSIDVGVIDVDGQDYWVWRRMEEYQPRIMLVEYSPYVEDSASTIPPVNGDGQATLAPIAELGMDKGYALAAFTYCNAFFVRKDVWSD